MSEIILHNQDNLPAMQAMPDNAFDLAIVDPPYGIGFSQFNRTNKTSTGVRYKSDKYKNSDWDASIPDEQYFTQLKRVSKNQIVWGGLTFLFSGMMAARVLCFGSRVILLKTSVMVSWLLHLLISLLSSLISGIMVL